MEEAVEVLQQLVADFGTIDYVGQQKCKSLTDLVSYGGLAASILAGFLSKRFDIAVFGAVASYAATVVLCLPWPSYRNNPVKFREPSLRLGHVSSTTVTTSE